MAGVLETVDSRTNLAGQNRLELLLFRLGGKQRFGINVFKVREVMVCPRLNQVPQSHSHICGVAHVRGKTFPVIDLPKVLDMPLPEGIAERFMIVTEFNRVVQGLLVHSVDRILNMRWEDILAPPAAGTGHYLTAITQVDDDLVEIIDVEKVLAEIQHTETEVTETLAIEAQQISGALPVLLADDSLVARNQMIRTMEQMGIPYHVAKNGREALEVLRKIADEGAPMAGRISMVISDIEMPEMDGYTLSTEIRKDPRLKELYVLLHSSLSGVFNDAMVKQVGADRFLPKFRPDELAQVVLERMLPKAA